MNRRAFSLFEILVALGVFAVAVTGLALALDAAVGSALEARERTLARSVLESRLAFCLANPPLEGRRVVEAADNNGVRIEESLDPVELKTSNGVILPGMYRLAIEARWGRGGTEKAEILFLQQ